MIIVETCHDIDFIYHVIESIWDETCEDGADFKTWKPQSHQLWLEVKDGEQKIGVYKLEWWNGTTIKLCANILPEYRKKHTYEITDKFHDWINENVDKKIKKLVAFIPSRFPNVIDYAAKSGWKKEGMIEKCFSKDNILYDLCIMGITIDQLKELRS